MTEKSGHPEELQFALWQPRWHRLDQSVSVGQSGRWWFYANAGRRDAAGTSGQIANLQLFNRMVTSTLAPEVRSATVVGIEHPVLGQLSAIFTDGLDYVFRACSGVEFIVNADEEPGTVYDMDDVVVDDWSVKVTFMNLSAPLADIA